MGDRSLSGTSGVRRTIYTSVDSQRIQKKVSRAGAFWFMSLAGSIILLAYSVHEKNPVFMLGFSLNMLIYLRNLHLIYNHAKRGVVTAVEKIED